MTISYPYEQKSTWQQTIPGPIKCVLQEINGLNFPVKLELLQINHETITLGFYEQRKVYLRKISGRISKENPPFPFPFLHCCCGINSKTFCLVNGNFTIEDCHKTHIIGTPKKGKQVQEILFVAGSITWHKQKPKRRCPRKTS